MALTQCPCGGACNKIVDYTVKCIFPDFSVYFNDRNMLQTFIVKLLSVNERVLLSTLVLMMHNFFNLYWVTWMEMT